MEPAKNGNGENCPEEVVPFIPPSLSERPYCNIVIKGGDVQDNKGKVFQFQTDSKTPEQNGNRNVHGPHHGDEKKKGFCGEYTGILLALMAGFIFTVGTILAKYMKQYHPFTLATYRLQGILIPSVFMVLYATKIKANPVFEPIWPIGRSREKSKTFFGVLLRASIGCTALYLHFYALQYLPVADVAVVNSCKPVFVTVAAFLLLSENCGVFPLLMAVLSMLGVVVIARPPILTGEEQFNMDTLVGVGFAVGSVITDTMVVIIIRHLKKIHVSVMMLILGLWGSGQSILFAYLTDELKLPQSGIDWAMAIGMAAVAILNQAGMHLALQYEQASLVAMTRTMDFIFAFMLQFLIMGVVPDLFSLTGAVIIIMCVLLTAYRKWLMGLPKSHSARERFWFVLK